MSIFRLTFIALLFGLFSCNKKVAAPTESKLFGLASPIQLRHGSNVMMLSDYFPDDLKIDSVRADAPLPLHIDHKLGTLDIVYPKNGLPMLMNLMVYAEGIPYSILLKSPTERLRNFTFNDAKTHHDVRIKGEFNSWNAAECVLKNDSNSTQWSGTFTVKPGKYQYKMVVDGVECDDPTNQQTMSNGMGGTNNYFIESGVPKDSSATLSTHSFENQNIYISSQKVKQVYAYWDNFRLEVKKSGNLWLIQIPPFAIKEPRSHIRVFGCNSVVITNDLLIPLDKGKVITDPHKLNNSDWQSSIMYFMMVDRFLDGDPTINSPVPDPKILPKANYMGGDLKGITQKIQDGYFRQLGINTIWISPIAQNPEDAWGQFKAPETKFSGYHGYWPISSSKVDHRFGNSEDLKELLAVAHANGLSVLLDYVANHVHQQHPVYQQHKDWVTPLYLPDGSLNTERWDDHRLTTWFDTFMPTLNLMDQKVTDFMVDSAAFWIKEYDFDGFRHDATKHIPENFWRSLTKQVKAESIKKGKYIYQIGETYGSRDLINSYIGSGMLDGQFDFNMYDNALPVFANKGESFARLAEALEASAKTYGAHHLMGNISGNQDKPRFMSYADGSLNFSMSGIEQKRLGWVQTIQVKDTNAYWKMAMFNAFNLTIPGIPIIYYGDEIGMAGAGDPDNRRMMKFENLSPQEQALKTKIEKLIALRSSNMALLYGDFKMVETRQDFLVYERNYFNNTVVVMLNKSNENINYMHKDGFNFNIPAGHFVVSAKTDNKRDIIQ